jgi:hypothetical protein
MITEILSKAQEVFPTEKARHNLTLNPETQRLELTIFFQSQSENKVQTFILDNEQELQKGVALIDEIQRLRTAPQQIAAPDNLQRQNSQ